MKTVKRIIAIASIFVMIMCIFTGCREADRVSYNVSKEADNFNVVRRLTAINTRNDTVLLQLTGTFSLKTDTDGDLNIICEIEDGKYQKHFVHINEWVTYVVEDLDENEVSKYSYEISFLPKSIGNAVKITTD